MNLVKIKEIEKWIPKHPRVAIRSGSEYSSAFVDMCEAPVSDSEGFKTQRWPGFNEHFGGSRAELVTITGETGRGKTTFALNWLLDTLDQGRKSLCISLEGGAKPAIAMLSQTITGKRPSQTSLEDRKKVVQMLELWPLWLLDHSGPLPENTLLHVIRYACEELGVRFIVLDHLDYVEKEWGKRNEAYVIGDCVRRLSGAAASNNCTIVLVCHPTKLGGDREVAMDDLKGSSSIKQESASVLSLYRPDPETGDAWLRFNKIRSPYFSRATGARLQFSFNSKKQEYREFTGKLDWSKK